LRALAWPALVTAGVLVPLVPGLLPGKTLTWRDSATLHAPMRHLIGQALREGRLPLWNPWEGGGQPFLAQSLHAVLHPVSALVAVVSDSTDLLLAVLAVTAALGAWAAARSLGTAASAAAVAAFGYGLSGYVLGMTSNALYLAGSATLPWMVAGLVRAASSPTGWILASAGVAAGGLVGDPGALIAGGIIGLALAWERGGRAGLVRAALGSMLGLAGAAAQLLPTWAYLPTTIRAAGAIGASQVEQWSLHPVRLLEVISPGLFVGLPRSYWAPVYEAFGSPAGVHFPWAPSVFLGAPVLVLAMAGARGNRAGRVLAGLACFFLWVSLGRHAGGTPALGAIPVWGMLRYWEKMVGPLSLCLALAAALGAQGLVNRDEQPVARWAALATAAAMGASLLAWFLPAVQGTPSWPFRERLVCGLPFAAASALLLFVAARAARAKPEAGASAVAALVFLQSVVAAPFALHYGSTDVLAQRPPPVVAAPPGPRIVTPLPFDFRHGIGETDAIDRSEALHYRTGGPSTSPLAGVENAEAYTGFGSMRLGIVATMGPLKWALLRRLGATHVVAPPPEDDEDRETLRRAIGPDAGASSTFPDGIQTWEVAHRPWASFAPSARAADGLLAAARAVGEELAAGRDTVVVEAPSAPATSAGTVRLEWRRPEALSLDAESIGPALLVVNDAFAPGWQAFIDGSPIQLLAADVLVRAVRWPAGRHRLVMRYDPPEVAIGMAISGAAVGVALLGLLLQRRRRAAA
jgi:hypothetical protein